MNTERDRIQFSVYLETEQRTPLGHDIGLKFVYLTLKNCVGNTVDSITLSSGHLSAHAMVLTRIAQWFVQLNPEQSAIIVDRSVTKEYAVPWVDEQGLLNIPKEELCSGQSYDAE